MYKVIGFRRLGKLEPSIPAEHRTPRFTISTGTAEYCLKVFDIMVEPMDHPWLVVQVINDNGYVIKSYSAKEDLLLAALETAKVTLRYGVWNSGDGEYVKITCGTAASVVGQINLAQGNESSES